MRSKIPRISVVKMVKYSITDKVKLSCFHTVLAELDPILNLYKRSGSRSSHVNKSV